MLASRRFFLPEVIQTSAMDCGPATLQCLLAGFGVRLSYGRLREACQTAVDGTSIDTIEEIASQLGLDAEQILIPPDHLLVPGARAFPAIAVVKQADGNPHFVVAWRRHGRVLQVVDPATGRRWPRCADLVEKLWQHKMAVPASAWRRWAASEDALRAVAFRVRAAGAGARAAKRVVERALADPSWHGIAALEAAARMTESIVASGGVARGRRAERFLESLFDAAMSAEPCDGGDTAVVPTGFWSARPYPIAPGEAPADGDEPALLVRGAVLVRVRRRAPGDDAKPAPGPLPKEIVAALEAPPERPFRDLVRTMREDGLLAPAVIAAALFGASVVVVAQALVLRGILGLGARVALPEQRFAAMGLLALFVGLALALDAPIAAATRRLGRHLETRVRAALLGAIPRLHDRYFRSRLVSDMADRAHGIHVIRALPDVCGGFLRALAELLLTTTGLVWIDPRLAPVAALAALVAVGLPLVAQPLLAERDLRVRNHAGALGLHYLDALVGLVPIRTHGAERTARRAHEGHLVRWARASTALLRASVVVEGAMLAVGYALAAALLFSHLAGASGAAAGGGVLLLAYWALRLPALGVEVVGAARGYLAQRSASLRATEPIGALRVEGAVEATPASGVVACAIPDGAIAFRMAGVGIVAGGHDVLRGVDLDVAAGTHVAIVGASGAGKSSLVGLLLGWHVPSEGTLTVAGAPLDGARLETLRRRTAWVDPSVRLWNRSLLENVLYGSGEGGLDAVSGAIEDAALHDALRALPRGLDTRLGEAGGFLSGGEGQRVRLARALLRRDAGLAILDEPFRGLDRDRRRELLLRARERWRGATLLCVTHDVGETLAFDRVLVVDGGAIVEDGKPEKLAAVADSLYRKMLDADRALREGGIDPGARDAWRRLAMRDGRVGVCDPDDINDIVGAP